MRYRADIDGLRAIAVLLVVGFHAFPDLFPGGYVGVDVFFVISGFLITGLILHELEAKEFSFRSFYARRVRRIFPALALVLAMCFAAGWVLLLPDDFRSLGWNILGGAAFSSNFVALGQSGYFDLFSGAKPLLHLWSLGIEEQFYIVWPLLVVLAFFARFSALILAAVVLVVSFAWNAKTAGTPSDFYLPFTRAWELMAGCLLAAFAAQSQKIQLSRTLGSAPERLVAYLTAVRPEIWSLAGLGLIVAAVVLLDRNRDFPGWWALLPALGTCLIILSSGSWLNRFVLSASLVVFIGLISYPFYLWHWPLLSFVNVIEPDPSPLMRGTAVLIALALAVVTYVFVEQPIRRGDFRALKIAGLLAVMLGLGGIGIATAYNEGFAWREPSIFTITPALKRDVDVRLRRHQCFLEAEDPQFAPECSGDGRHPLLFLWGDSYAAALYPGLKNLQRYKEFGIAQYTSAGCPPVQSLAVPGRPYCVENNELAFSALKQAQPDLVLLDAVWPWWDSEDFILRLGRQIAALNTLKVPRVVILGPIPARVGGLPKAVVDYHRAHHQLIPTRSSFRVIEDWFDFQKRFRQRVQNMAEYISLWDAMCEGTECLTRVGEGADDLVAFDEAHLTLRGSTYAAEKIAPCLFPGLKTKIPASTEDARICSHMEAGH